MAIQKISNAVIADDAVDADNIATGAITVADIPDGEITTAKIGDDQITNAKIAPDAVTSTEIANGSVTYDQIASGTIITSKIADGQITSAKMASNITLNASDYILDGISTNITDTAVDIFIYDTSKDSDGGEWRNRTQDTSWYNETLNTSTRGSRREFPAVAVIVAETSKITIYDGDDPAMPMWMVFNPNGIIDWATSQQNRLAISAMNGSMVNVGHDGGNIFKFIEDFVDIIYSSDNYPIVSSRTIEGRNDPSSYYTNANNAKRVYEVLTYSMYDVDMTVLPNAPIDPATGLPTPTIAVATANGISVIENDGTVTSSASNSSYPIYEVNLLSTGEMYHRQGEGSNEGVNYNNPYSRISGVDLGTYANSTTFWYANDGIGNSSNILGYNTVAPNCIVATEKSTFHVGDAQGLSNIYVNSSSVNDGMVNWITNDYATGWMPGDIKLAVLADTDDTNLTDTNLLPNGTFSNGLTGWTLAGTTTPTISSSGGQFGGPGALLTTGTIDGSISQTLSLSSSTYIINWLITQDNGGDFTLYINGNKVMDYMGDGGGSEQNFYIHTGSITSIEIRHRYSGSGIIDSIWIQALKERDRSVNGNHIRSATSGSGIIKTPVETGADLVGYRFSDNNHFVSPYNTDFDFGTNPFSITVWVKMDAVSNQNTTILDRTVGGQANAGRILIYPEYANQLPRIYIEGPTGSSYVTGQTRLDFEEWTFLHFNRRGDGTLEVWVNGLLESKGGISVDSININARAEMRIGANWGGSQWFPGEMALLRISGTVPSEEQIAKMYDDEKQLFQENAQATLHGSSDAVTALAYDNDTELLHVGTSAGRSVFQGLRRVENTTDAVSTAISANNGMVAEQ